MSDKRILDIIASPADLKLLSNEELSILAGEIRHEIVTTTSKTGGHVASSLGAVEIILALQPCSIAPRTRSCSTWGIRRMRTSWSPDV